MRIARCTFGGWLVVAAACHDGAPAPKQEPPRDDRSPCAALCERLAECGPPRDFEGLPGCTRTCEEDPRQISGPCREPRLAYERCMVRLPCEDVRANHGDLAAAKHGPCASEITAVLGCEPDDALPLIDFQF